MAKVKIETEDIFKYFESTITPGTIKQGINNQIDELEYVYGVRETKYSKMLGDFTKQFKDKHLIISVKPIADWINSDYSRKLCDKYNNYFNTQKLKIDGEEITEMIGYETTAYIGSDLYYQGIPDQTVIPKIDLNVTWKGRYLNQRNSVGPLLNNGLEAEFLPVNLNQMMLFKFNGREMLMPYFYKAPHDDIKDLKSILKIKAKDKLKLYQAQIANNGKANLAIVKETDSSIIVSIMSIAGLHFIYDIIINYLDNPIEQWNEFVQDEGFRKMADIILRNKEVSIKELNYRIQDITATITSLYRQKKTEELILKEMDRAKIIKELISKIGEDAKICKTIKSVYISANGNIGAVMGPLKLML
jgi:two-component sensor histidine kinase